MPSVNSSAMSFVEYIEETQTLRITFDRSGTYDFFNVPKSLYEELLAAKSKGQFYNRFIKDKYN